MAGEVSGFHILQSWYRLLTELSNGEPDIALFDFTSLKKAENASRIIERRKKKLVLALVGDSLIEVSVRRVMVSAQPRQLRRILEILGWFIGWCVYPGLPL